ncbi:MAG: hypothetical protein K2X99_12990 [Gemmatimonadaceae bacterium]|nr:hypothetical protein [Gemmatimonadaceae bacterium]
MRVTQIVAIGSLVAVSMLAAQNAPPPCKAPEASQFDFWVGKWELTWPQGQGGPGPNHGTNEITKELDGCVIHEHFAGAGAGALAGRSYSLFDAARGQWLQTWVDNQGGYIPLSGSFREGRMELRTPVRRDRQGRWQLSRMVFRDITPASFVWDWEASSDSGATWQSNWNVTYRRVR